MYECRRCRNEFPDDTAVCPICGTINRRIQRKKTRSIRALIYIADLLIVVMSFIGIMMCLMCSHYCLDYEYGIFLARKIYWTQYPALIPIDIIFSTLYVAMPLLSLIANRKMVKRRRVGAKLATCLCAVLFLSYILYPTATYFVTSIVTPVLSPTIVICSVFVCVSVVVSILLLRSKELYL